MKMCLDFLHGDFWAFPGMAWHGRFIPLDSNFIFNHLVILDGEGPFLETGLGYPEGSWVFHIPGLEFFFSPFYFLLFLHQGRGCWK